MIMKTKLPVVLCVLFGLLNGGLVPAQSSPTDKEVFSMLKTFYTNYILTWNNVSSPEKKLDSILKQYCDPQLLSKIKHKTKTGELDYDPFLKAQDIDTASLRTSSFGKDTKRVDIYTSS